MRSRKKAAARRVAQRLLGPQQVPKVENGTLNSQLKAMGVRPGDKICIVSSLGEKGCTWEVTVIRLYGRESPALSLNEVKTGISWGISPVWNECVWWFV